MPSNKAVQSDAVVSPTSTLAPVKVARKRATAKVTEPVAPASATKKSVGARKKAAVAADTTNVAAVSHRHKKQDAAMSAVSVPPVGSAAPAYEPGHYEVASLAYSYYVARGYQSGDQGADWFRAVQELKQRHLVSLLTDSK